MRSLSILNFEFGKNVTDSLASQFRALRDSPPRSVQFPCQVLFFLLANLIFASSMSFAEGSPEMQRQDLFCSKALNSYTKIAADNWRASTIPRPASIYISLLVQTLAEIGALNDIDLNGYSHALQMRILHLVATSNIPIDPLEELVVDPSADSFFKRSLLLKLLMANKAFRKSMSNISKDDWNHIKEFSIIEKSAKQAQVQKQNEAQQHSKQDFVEVGPDFQGRVRLHYFIEQRNFADAIALLNHPTTTTRYINTRDNANETPLDIFFRIFPESKDAFLQDSTPLPSHLNEQPEIQSVFHALKRRSARTHTEILALQSELLDALAGINFDSNHIDWIFQQGADLNFVEENGESALSIAARTGNIDVVRALLRHDVKLNPLHPWGDPPIFLAALMGRAEIVKLLASAGADISKTYNGYSLAYFAVREFQASTFRLLAEIGVDLQFHGKPTPNPVFELRIPEHAKTADVEEFFKVFNEFGLDLSHARSEDNSTPAHIAVQNKNPRDLQALAKYGADLDKKDYLGYPPLHFVRRLSFRETLDPHSDYQNFLEIFYNYYTEKGIPPAERYLEKRVINGKAIYQYEGVPKIEEGTH